MNMHRVWQLDAIHWRRLGLTQGMPKPRLGRPSLDDYQSDCPWCRPADHAQATVEQFLKHHPVYKVQLTALVLTYGP